MLLVRTRAKLNKHMTNRIPRVFAHGDGRWLRGGLHLPRAADGAARLRAVRRKGDIRRGGASRAAALPQQIHHLWWYFPAEPDEQPSLGRVERCGWRPPGGRFSTCAMALIPCAAGPGRKPQPECAASITAARPLNDATRRTRHLQSFASFEF